MAVLNSACRCRPCAAVFVTVPNVDVSVFLCAGERPFKCESCNYLAANQHEVTRHARQVHNGPKPLSCPYCDYKTADRSNYKKHVELHLNPRQFLCPLCKYAASKKCNLQYHLKSRHAGCDVAMDISKVKLRVKKAAPNGDEESAREAKLHSTSTTQEDMDMDRDSRDKGVDANPINLSIRRSSRPGVSQSVQSDAPDKAQEKTCSPSDREKRITTRQKVKRAPEKVPEQEIQPGSTPASKTVDGKARAKVKKLQAEKTAAENPSEEQEQVQRPGPGPSEDRKKGRPDKEKQRKKKKALHQSRRAGSQQSEKASKQPDHSQQKAGGLQKSPEHKLGQENAPKRKAAEALDLSTSSPDQPPKTRRMKGAEKLHPIPEEAAKTAPFRSTAASSSSKQKRSKRVRVQDHSLGVHRRHSTVPGGPAPLHTSSSSHAKNSPAKNKASPGPPGLEEPPQAGDSPAKPASQQRLDPSQKALCVAEPHTPAGRAPDPPSPAAPEPPADPAEPADAVHGPAHQVEDSSPSQESSPVTSPPTLALPVGRSQGSDPEDDEGIHSSHEGGSDISDSASEASEDSGLNSNAPGSAKPPNDPETPTDEVPTPTQLKSHMCIFCDRSFPLEAAYRRHLHRHLVNVYYMDSTGASAQK